MNIRKSFAKLAVPLALTASVVGLSGCSRDSEIVSQNLSEAADNFEIDRRIVFYNSITDTYMLEIDGKCSIKADNAITDQISIICRTGADSYKKDYLHLSNNVTYFMEQMDGANVSAYNYTVTFKPQVVVPDVVVKGRAEDLRGTVTPRPGMLQSAAGPN